MPWVLSLVAVVFLGLAGSCWYAAFDKVRKALPHQLTEEQVRWEIDPFIWTPFAPQDARRPYVWFHVWGSLSALCLGAAVWSAGEVVGAAAFAAIALLTSVRTAVKCHRHGC